MDEPANQTPPTEPKAKSNKTVIVVLAAVVVLGLSGFVVSRITHSVNQKMGEKAVENMIESASGGKADVDINSDSMTVKTDEGSFSAGSDLPADLPQDVPVYPGASVSYSGTSNTQSGNTEYAVVFSTDDSYQRVAQYYSGQLPEQGWEISSTQNVAGTTVISATKDARTIAVAAASDDTNTTTITLTITHEE